MKTIGTLTLALLLTAFSQANGQVKVGYITPLTGPRASIGEDAMAGVSLALADLRRLGQTGFDVVFEDSQGDPAKGVAAYKKLQLDGIRFLITQNSNVSLAIEPLAIRDRVLQLAVTTTSERYATPDDTTFRTNGSTRPEAQLMAQTLMARMPAAALVALVTMQDEYPATLEKYLLAELEQRRLSVMQESFSPAEADFRAILSRLSAKKDLAAVVFLGYQSQAGVFIKQFRERGSPAPLVLMNTPVNNREFFDIAGDTAEGVLLTYPLPRLDHPVAASFKATYGREINFFSANAYDAVLLAHKAFAGCSNVDQVPCLKAQLESIKEFDGVSGRKGFDARYGDMTDSYSVLIARDKKFIPLNSKPG